MQLLGMNAGDVCIFMAATQTHGAAGWRGEEARRCVIMGIWSRTRARRREQLAEERLLQAAAGCCLMPAASCLVCCLLL